MISRIIHKINCPLIFLLFVVFLAFRIKGNLFYPNLFVEDRYEYFSFLNQFSSILDANFQTIGKFNLHTHFDVHKYYTGVSILVAWLFTYFSIWWQPYLYTLFAFSTVITAIWLFVRLSCVTRKVNFFFSLFIVSLLGVNHIYLWTTMSYTFYTLNLILLLIALFAKIEDRQDALILAVIASILVWAGPYCVLIIPILVMRLYFERNRFYLIFSILVLINLAAYLYLSADNNVNDNVDYQVLFNSEMFSQFLTSLVSHVFLFNIIETSFLTSIIVCLFLLAVIVYLYSCDRGFFRVNFILLVTIIANLILFYISGKYLKYTELKPGHIYISLFLWSGLIALWLNYACTKKGFGRQSQAVIFFVLVFLAYSVDQKHQDYRYVEPDPRILPFLVAIKTITPEIKDNTFVIMRNYRAKKSPTVVIGDKTKGSMLLRVKDFKNRNDIARYIYEL